MLAADVLRTLAEGETDRIAIDVDGHAQISYGDWERRSNRLARGLIELGVEPGDRVGIRLSNASGVDYLVAYFGCQKSGATAVPINTRLAPREAAYIIDHAEPRVVLAHAEARADLASMVGQTQTAPKLVMLEGARSESWNSLEAAQSDEAIQIDRTGDDIADILYTSGTTGRPKGVASTHADVGALANGMGGKIFAGSTFLHAFPMHTFAGTHGMTMLALSGGMTTLIQPKFHAERFLELIGDRGVNLVYVAPAMILLMLRSPVLGKHRSDSLRLILYGSAPMPPDAIPRLAKAFPGAMQANVYGLTEGGSAACSLSPEEAMARPGSIGKPYPPAEVSVRDDAGNEVSPGTHGEIWLRSGGPRRRYFKDDRATSETWTADGWLKTGDVGHVDAAGFLYLDDRKKDVIVRGGHNVYPAEVEAALLEHPDVVEAAVVGIDHDVLGEDVKAFVVVQPGRELSDETLAEFLKERVADYKVPRQVDRLSELPRNAMGKVLRRVLRDGAA